MATKRNGNFRSSDFISQLILSTGKRVNYFSLKRLQKAGFGNIDRLPFSIRVVLESLLRNCDGRHVRVEDVAALSRWNPKKPRDAEVPFKVARILMQDFTGVPAVVDLAAMRSYIAGKGHDAGMVRPRIPVDLVIDHSVQVDAFNTAGALEKNQSVEFGRNKERYHLLKWAHSAFSEFTVFPPSAGICHQINLEFLSPCVRLQETAAGVMAFPDTLVGTDSHTTMINGLGVVGFGVGGIEAEAAVLGEPVPFLTPKVLGVRLEGRLREGVTATDFALTLTRILRERGVVNNFVEFFGPGLRSLSLPDRATLSNMCPEYGATVAIFPVDDETLRYMRQTGRSGEQIELVKRYYEAQGIFGAGDKTIQYSDVLEVELGDIVPAVSGPSQPKQEVPLWGIAESFYDAFMLKSAGQAGYAHHKLSSSDYTRWSSESLAVENGRIKGAPKRKGIRSVRMRHGGSDYVLSDGDVVIASITSCTNTSNPAVMVAAGLLAKKALERGLRVNTDKVKTSLGPGSRVVMDYLERAHLIEPLAKMGFGLVGFGCITCIGNSGPLIEGQSDAINKHDLAVAAVLSGNRNYEARIHRDVRANYLMSPPLVIAFAIAGTVLIDLEREPLGRDGQGRQVFLRDIWPSSSEIHEVINADIDRQMFRKAYGNELYKVNPYWNKLRDAESILYKWDRSSTYIELPPFFGEEGRRNIGGIRGAAVLAVFGDSVSTDHISPAGAIGVDSPAGRYLEHKGIGPADFNTYGSRRGNHEVMMRGTFANNRIKNLLMKGDEGGFTLHYPDGKRMSIFDASVRYRREGRPLVVIAGKEYGSGSSRDWAAKGPMMLGVRAVLAQSFERIHRSNLVGMGIMPLQFRDGEGYDNLQIDPSLGLDILADAKLEPMQEVQFGYYKRGSGKRSIGNAVLRIDTPLEMEYYEDGGVLQHVAARLMKENR